MTPSATNWPVASGSGGRFLPDLRMFSWFRFQPSPAMDRANYAVAFISALIDNCQFSQLLTTSPSSSCSSTSWTSQEMDARENSNLWIQRQLNRGRSVVENSSEGIKSSWWSGDYSICRWRSGRSQWRAGDHRQWRIQIQNKEKLENRTKKKKKKKKKRRKKCRCLRVQEQLAIGHQLHSSGIRWASNIFDNRTEIHRRVIAISFEFFTLFHTHKKKIVSPFDDEEFRGELVGFIASAVDGHCYR